MGVTRQQRRRVDRLYAELPTLECKGLCADSCGPIAMSRVEYERLSEAAGFEPTETTGPDGLTCPLLVDQRCSVYDVRPMICRLWGMVEKMPCPWGCVPSRMLTDVDARRLLHATEVM